MKETIGPSTLLHRAKDMPFSQLDDEFLAVDAQAGYCYALNETASRVWDLLAEPVSFGDLCTRLCREFAVAEAVCAREVKGLLRGLHEAVLVQIGG